VTLQASCDIRVPAPQVWDLLADVAHWDQWTKAVGSVVTEPGPVRVGQQPIVRLPWYTSTTYGWTVTAVEPGRSFTWTASGASNDLSGTVITGTHEITPGSAGCTVEVTMTFTGRLGGVAERLSRRRFGRYLQRLTADLKTRAESA